MPILHKKIDLWNPLKVNPTMLVDKLFNEIDINKDLTLILDSTWEPKVNPDAWLAHLNNFVIGVRNKKPDCKILLVANSWWKYYHSIIDNINFNDVLYVDYFLYRAYNEIIKQQKSAAAYRWSSHAKKFLFLIAKLPSPHRIRLLWKFMSAGLENQLTWSLHLPNDMPVVHRQAHKLIPELSSSEFNNFIEQYKRNPDNIELDIIKNCSQIQYTGIPYDVTLYTTSSFSVISETLFLSGLPPWITEKTWIPIINNHPFIIIGDTHTLEKLNDMGFVTYETLLPVQNYNLIEDQELALDAVVQNASYWVNHIQEHQTVIKQIVQHNNSVIKELYNKNLNSIEKFIITHQLPLEVSELVPTDKFHPQIISYEDELQIDNDQKFCIFYNNIKDDNWPDCYLEDNFKNLPIEIQKECIEIFGYVPNF